MKSLFCILLVVFVQTKGLAQQPGVARVTGEVSRTGFSIGKCNINSMTVKYELSTYMGEPTVGSNLKWTTGYSTDKSCLQGESFEIFIKASVGNYTGAFLIRAGEGTIPKGDGSYGYNPLSGSPDWDELLIPYDYGGVKAFQTDRKFMAADKAKKIWKEGFKILGVVFIDKSGGETALMR